MEKQTQKTLDLICRNEMGEAVNAPSDALYGFIERTERINSYRNGNTLNKIKGTLRLIGDIPIELGDMSLIEQYYFYEAAREIKYIWKKN